MAHQPMAHPIRCPHAQVASTHSVSSDDGRERLTFDERQRHANGKRGVHPGLGTDRYIGRKHGMGEAGFAQVPRPGGRVMLKKVLLILMAALATVGCPDETAPAPTVVYPDMDIHFAALGCWTLEADATSLRRSGDSWGFSEGEGTPLFAQPSDLGTILLFGPEGGYVMAEGTALLRSVTLESDATTYDDSYISGAEWLIETSQNAPARYQLRSRRMGALLSTQGLAPDDADGAALSFVPAEGCATHPELTLNAEGSVTRTTWDDGELYGFVDLHSHIFSNKGFGGAMFHGAPFHRLGVAHALGDCAGAHGTQGRTDFFGFFYDKVGNSGAFSELIPDMLAGELSEDNHATDGYPTFTEWPNVRKRATHQAQYYRWLERAWLGGLRLVFQHATSNSVICNLSVGEGWAPSRFDCEDMTAVDQQIDAAYALERYVDARHGGPGQGWFRVVTTPSEAREVISGGKLAVVLGIETSDLFNCHLTPRPGGQTCDEDHVDRQLDAYFARGVRIVFPVHKYDNAFGPGDGQGGFIEVGNFLNSGHYTNLVTEDCPTEFDPGFDHGDVTFGGLWAPRDDYLSSPTEDFTDFPIEPIATVLPYTAALLGAGLEGDYCQNGTLTEVGEHLVDQILRRGMLMDVAHLPRRSYARAYDILSAAEYPALNTHGRDFNGLLFGLGGMSQGGFGRCHDSDDPTAHLAFYRERLSEMVAAGMHPSLGFGFDLNGFAGGRGPRFGQEGCGPGQENPVTYPFSSFAGDVTFTEPWSGERLYDFNTEGMAHVGLIPEYVEDARLGGAGDDDLEPLFRSAEGAIQMWERAQEKSAALNGR